MLLKRFILILFVFSLIPTHSYAEEAKISKEEWGMVLTELGTKPDETMTEKERNKLISRIMKFSTKVEKIQASSDKQMSIEDWTERLLKKKIKPKEDMKKDEWRLILSLMDVELPVEVFVSPVVEEQPKAPQAILAQPTQAGLDSPQVQVQPIQTEASPELKPVEIISSPEKRKEPSIKISLDIRNMDIVDVLRLLSNKSGKNILVGKNVKGKITLFIKNVDFWDALQQILEANGLAYAEEGDILKVMAMKDYEKEYGTQFGDKTVMKIFKLEHAKAESVKKALESFKSKVGVIHLNEKSNSLIVMDIPKKISILESLVRNFDVPSEKRLFNLNYAKVDDVLSEIEPLRSKAFGRIQGNKRSNSIFVTDSPTRVAEIAGVIEAFDVQHRTVLIEAKIVQIILSDDFQWGIDWGHMFSKINTESISGRVTGILGIIPTGSLTKTEAQTNGITATATRLDGEDITATLNILDTVGKSNLLSSPRITVINNQEAKILVGTREVYVTSTVITPGGTAPTTTTENVTFVDVGVKLFVTPSIGDDGFVTMKIRPEVSSVDSTLTTAEGNAIPIVRTSEAETQVMVKDGVSIVIGGLIEDRVSKNVNRVPILGWIPILGLPFKSISETTEKTELVIFLTPHIISGDVNAPEAEVYLSNGKKKG